MPETQVTLRCDTELYQCFRAACIRRGTTPTKVMARLIQEEMDRWQESVTMVHEEATHA